MILRCGIIMCNVRLNLSYCVMAITGSFDKLLPMHVEFYGPATMIKRASPDGSCVSTGACKAEVPGSNPGRDGYLSSWLCIGPIQCSKMFKCLERTVLHI